MPAVILSRVSRSTRTLVLLFAAGFPTFVRAQPDLTFTVQTGTRYQTLDNFGTSAAFELNEITEAWSESNLDSLAKILFSTDIRPDWSLAGIGLSGFRVEIGACSFDQGSASQISRNSARSKCPLRPDSTYDWSQMDAEVYWARKAHAYGLRTVMGYSNSPPIYFTKNGLACRTQGNGVANLRPDAYDDFAEYLARVAARFDSIGYPLRYISPVNEPQWGWYCNENTQEGSQWSTEEIRHLADSLNAAFLRRGVSTSILLTEAGQIDYV
jgi:O-glycosyl hydrolase